MPPFPFLKLPLLAQKVIIHESDFYDLIELSRMSKKFKNILEQVKIKVKEFKMFCDVYSFHLYIDIDDRSDSAFQIVASSLSVPKTTSIVKLGGINLHKTADTKYKKFMVKSKDETDESKLESLEKVTGQLLKIFKVENFHIYIHKNIDILNLFIWKHTTRFDNVQLSQHIGHDGLKFILENLTINFLYLNVQIKNDPDIKYHCLNLESSRIRKISIMTENWLEHGSLLNMAQESIQCRISNKFSRKANKILKKWMSGTNEKLEVLTLWASGKTQYMKERILHGTNAAPSVFTKDELKKLKSSSSSILLLKLYNAMDIHREHDGCQATVLFELDEMHLIVWNEKHLKAIGRL